MPTNGPFDNYLNAPAIYDTLPHGGTTYGEPYLNAYSQYVVKVVQVVTTTLAFELRYCFLTKAAAEAAITALQAIYDAEGAALNPPISVATVTGKLGYDGLAYDVIVNYSKITQETQEIAT